MKLFFALFMLSMAVRSQTSGDLKCTSPIGDAPSDWIDMGKDCLDAMRRQIQIEIDTSYIYLGMGAHFSRDTINRPGFAELFFTYAKEERAQAQKLTEYLSMRGELTDNISNLIKVPRVEKKDWANGRDALEDALKLVTEVIKSLQNLIKKCETGDRTGRNVVMKNDYHLTHHLTRDYLENNLKKQRELASNLNTLQKMSKNNNDALSEFFLDFNNYGNASIKIGIPSIPLLSAIPVSATNHTQ